MNFLERGVGFVSRLCDQIAQAGVFVMTVLVVISILMRKAGKPLYGVYDYVSFIGAIVVAFSLANCAVHSGHAQVGMLVERFSERVQGIIDSITGVISLIVFVLITWQCVVLANDMRSTGEVSMTSHIPFHPYIYAIAFGCALACLPILAGTVSSFFRAVKR